MRTLLVFLVSTVVATGATLKAGVGRADITPAGPIWLSGYAARTHPSDGALHKLWAKALAIESGPGERVVIVSTDVVGIPRAVADDVAARVERQYGIRRAQILLNASHTHTGPVVWSNLNNLTVFPPEEQAKLVVYARKFADDIVAAVGEAVRDLAPATVEYGSGTAGFAANRRVASANGYKIGVNPGGPTDRTVPVLKITGVDGKVRAVLFGYACHNTTLTGEVYQLSGDYAGFAAAEIEAKHPGSTALFLMLCGADQNPNPRGTIELGRKWGGELASEVDRVISAKMTALEGPVRPAFRVVALQLATRARADFETELKAPLAAQARRGRMMLDALDTHATIDRIEYPVQAVRFGHGLTLVALGGEVVIDYALRIAKEYAGEPLIVAGYSNDVMAYIPSARVLREGGYEADDSMIYYGQQGPFADDVEERVIGGVHRVMEEVGRTVEVVEGDPVVGKDVFVAQSCNVCHKVDGAGGELGPDLSRMESRSAAYLRESVRNPDAVIVPGYPAVTVVTKAGASVRGLFLGEDDGSVRVREMSGGARTFRKDEVREVRRETTSLMPAFTMPSTDLDNIVAFLKRLKSQ
jgi:putative heme-binding domain-containing protein